MYAFGRAYDRTPYVRVGPGESDICTEVLGGRDLGVATLRKRVSMNSIQSLEGRDTTVVCIATHEEVHSVTGRTEDFVVYKK